MQESFDPLINGIASPASLIYVRESLSNRVIVINSSNFYVLNTCSWQNPYTVNLTEKSFPLFYIHLENYNNPKFPKIGFKFNKNEKLKVVNNNTTVTWLTETTLNSNSNNHFICLWFLETGQTLDTLTAKEIDSNSIEIKFWH